MRWCSSFSCSTGGIGRWCNEASSLPVWSARRIFRLRAGLIAWLVTALPEVQPRQLFCAPCIQRLFAEQGDDNSTPAMRELLRSAYTALLEISGSLLPSTVADAQGRCIRAAEELVSEGGMERFADGS